MDTTTMVVLMVIAGLLALMLREPSRLAEICTDNQMQFEVSSNGIVRCSTINEGGKIVYVDFDKKTGEKI